MRPIRRVIAGNDERGVAAVLSDGPSPDVRLDPARPGFALTRLWVTDTTPARVKGVRETLHLPHTLEPPQNGSVFRVAEYPPEAPYMGRITSDDARAWFAAMGSPDAVAAGNGARHPYMQRTASLDFCFIVDGEIVLVLDTGDVQLKAGDAVIQRGTRHAWSNRSDKPCLIAMAQFSASDARGGGVPRPSEKLEPKPPANVRHVRRVVTGHDAQGHSCVVHDSAVPNYFPRVTGKCFYELWTADQIPAGLAGNADAGAAGLPFQHSPPTTGAHWRITQAPAVRLETASAHEAAQLDAANRTGGTERLAGGRKPGMHCTPTVDYGVCLEGTRTLVMADGEVPLHKGDVVIQLGGWHTWDESSGAPTLNSVVMIGGEFAS